MNKICTSLEQSKKLLELGIDVNTADMIYQPIMDIDSMSNVGFDKIPLCVPFNEVKECNIQYLPAWSLSALLEFINRNEYNMTLKYCGAEYTISFDDSEKYKSITKDYSIDAAFEMVVWLKENKKI